jgi:hypothetical protein
VLLLAVEAFEAVEQAADLERQLVGIERMPFGGAFAERDRLLDLARRLRGFVDFGRESRGSFLGFRLRSLQGAPQCLDLGFVAPPCCWMRVPPSAPTFSREAPTSIDPDPRSISSSVLSPDQASKNFPVR